MSMNRVTLKVSLFALTLYFLAMSVAHFVGFKVPFLFIYYDVPSTPYQDQIISFCAFSYAVFSFAATRHLIMAPYFLIAMLGVILGLSGVNLSQNLNEFLQRASTSAYWLQTFLITVTMAWLLFFYLRALKE